MMPAEAAGPSRFVILGQTTQNVGDKYDLMNELKSYEESTSSQSYKG